MMYRKTKEEEEEEEKEEDKGSFRIRQNPTEAKRKEGRKEQTPILSLPAGKEKESSRSRSISASK